jgi:protein-S-isoprenylcysteine O-methyltransferase Ste14
MDGPFRQGEKQMLFKDPLHWFPDPYFSSILAIFVFGMYVIDYAVAKANARGRAENPILVRDGLSFLVIQFAGIAAIVAALLIRSKNWLIAPGVVQYLGLLLIPAGLGLRVWAISKLGRFFARMVQIEPDHHLITDGPYRWIRHPAYTGMILIYLGIALAIGTWLGAALTLGLVLAASLYRIRLEEQVLVEAFGNAYQDYMKRTWRLLPGL